MAGVKIGIVKALILNPETYRVKATFSIKNTIKIASKMRDAFSFLCDLIGILSGVKKFMRKFKVLAIVIVVLASLVCGYLYYSMAVINPRVAKEITSNPDGERAGIVGLFTLPSGRKLPANYLREGNKVFVGVDGRWWRELTGSENQISMLIRGQVLKGTARVVLNDPTYTSDVFARLRPKAPGWLPVWLNGKLVVITLQSEGGNSK